MKIFVTGGSGYIGSHTILELLRAGHEVYSCDNYCNSSSESLRRVRRLANLDFGEAEIDVRDPVALQKVLEEFPPDVVIHFAGLKAVETSVQKPLEYYDNNVVGTLRLLQAMDAVGCDKIVFSSSATVYGDAAYLPYDEDHPLAPTNPYGQTKLAAEDIIRDWCAAKKSASGVLLRYFNPVGAHASGDIGEDPNGVPANLMPYIAQVAIGRRAYLRVFGNDYSTRDGTGERDYIHVVDLAQAHVRAIEYAASSTGCEAINVGTGHGITVLEMVEAFAKACQREVPYQIVDRRPGDVARSVASVEKARQLLGWTAQLGLDEMCQTAWTWQSSNPNGLETYRFT